MKRAIFFTTLGWRNPIQPKNMCWRDTIRRIGIDEMPVRQNQITTIEKICQYHSLCYQFFMHQMN